MTYPTEIRGNITLENADNAMEKLERLCALLKEAKELYDSMASDEWELTFTVNI